MKIVKLTFLTTLLVLTACNMDQTVDQNRDESINNAIQKTNAEYSLEDVLNGMRAWQNIRGNETELLNVFNNHNGLEIDLAFFPQNSSLHAYACILDGQLKFAIISEVYDNESYHNNLIDYIKIVDLNYHDVSELGNQNYQEHNFPLPTQYIQATEAVNRIQDWNTHYTAWITTSLPMYQSFNIPTYSLSPQPYTVYMGLKNSDDNPSVKVADLILNNGAGVYYDTVRREPPYRDRSNYYILDLL
ncbi:hypothetical protein MG290_06750 [Flavobacterium sp. CBA20B-1]|uniref:hypothetical protein n=1 Tax=unclassified Flavobacterium TaxID=196869 RepID=UPI002224FDC1|nr:MULTISPECIES: hypothetical protein [unclassified Flavobacterium]WCM43355.1 hypothetical protein MG290_06750 [Flavobacterium sp. CBA20B-1]